MMWLFACCHHSCVFWVKTSKASGGGCSSALAILGATTAVNRSYLAANIRPGKPKALNKFLAVAAPPRGVCIIRIQGKKSGYKLSRPYLILSIYAEYEQRRPP